MINCVVLGLCLSSDSDECHIGAEELIQDQGWFQARCVTELLFTSQRSQTLAQSVYNHLLCNFVDLLPYKPVSLCCIFSVLCIQNYTFDPLICSRSCSAEQVRSARARGHAPGRGEQLCSRSVPARWSGGGHSVLPQRRSGFCRRRSLHVNPDIIHVCSSPL